MLLRKCRRPKVSGFVLLIVGPTASGKSKIALQVAKRLSGEIVSCDSMQVYRGMSIGTAKPTRGERRAVKHHMIDRYSSRAVCSAERYRRDALLSIRGVLSRKRLPIVVGGSGLYVKGLIDGFSQVPARNRAYRRFVESKAKRRSTARLYGELRSMDPGRACELNQADRKRIIRALEICLGSKNRTSNVLPPTGGLSQLEIPHMILGLRWDRSELNARINERVDEMFRAGWVHEVKRLKRKGLSQTARQAIGYQEILRHLKGDMSYEDAVLQTKRRSRYLAKKQRTWFYRDKRIKWIDLRGDERLDGKVRDVMELISKFHADLC
jgi:tRNA dimethylallyltransferase